MRVPVKLAADEHELLKASGTLSKSVPPKAIEQANERWCFKYQTHYNTCIHKHIQLYMNNHKTK